MNLSKSMEGNLSIIKSRLNLDKSFDLINRTIVIGGRRTSILFIDGFIKDEVMEKIMEGFFKITKEEIDKMETAKGFIEYTVPYVEVDTEKEIDKIISTLLAGPTVMIIDGFDEAVILDIRTYPARTTTEPDKEKVTRGSKDGFVETIVFNTALIRRRIRDPKLTFEMLSVGSRSKTDVAIGYIDGLENSDLLNDVKEKISELKVEALTMNQESLLEALVKYKFYNPFPKVKYTERPDVAAAHILEGKIVVIVDNTPNVMVLPSSFLDFIQEIEDFYYPPVTGSYLRLIRILVMLLTLVLTPTWLLIMQYQDVLPPYLTFLTVAEMNSVPLILQFLLLELAIDGLKMASLNTPSSLGTSLGIIGGLILGDFAVKSGWFVPDTILYMSFIAVGSFTQPSIELSYAIKFCRVILLITTWGFGVYGYVAGLILIFGIILSNKTLTGIGYLYPLLPFNAKDLKGVVYRRSLRENSKQEK
ncbi:MAG: spore germination protein [Clostridium sp.]|uniref:spore germination protein n=1 Tax=Clostridium sp. TaxID=1506 RepID=UPI003063D228